MIERYQTREFDNLELANSREDTNPSVFDSDWEDQDPDEEDLSLLASEIDLDPDHAQGTDSSGFEDQDTDYSEYSAEEDLVRRQIREAGRVPLLTAEQEIELAQRIELGVQASRQLEKCAHNLETSELAELERLHQDGEAAREHMVRANARLVISIAKRYQYRGVPFLDLIQEGNIGLIRATTKFEYQRGFRFSTYATWWIRQSVSRAVADQGRTIRVPVHIGEAINRMHRIELELRESLHRDPTDEEIAAEMEIKPARVDKLRQANVRPTSIDAPVDDQDGLELSEVIEDEESSVEDMVDSMQLAEQLNEALRTLSDRKAYVLRLRFGLEDGRVYTLEEVGDMIGVSKEAVRQIEAKALRDLRNGSAHRTLKAHLALK